MIDVRQEQAQQLLDKLSRGQIDRRSLLRLAGAAGIGSLLAPLTLQEAAAAGATQLANRKALQAGYDYIIVGAGAAGCILASELSATGAKVLILEAGGDEEAAGEQVTNPSIWFTNISGPLDWAFPTVPTSFLNGRSIPIGAGKVLGGGTSINASAWVRGFAADFDNWAYNGCAGWSFEDILPIYKKLENWEGGANEWRGSGGPMDVRLPRNIHPAAQAWIDGEKALGLPYLDDMNAPSREGVGLTNMNVRPDGSRASASRAYLRPALSRPNLTLLINTTATSLIMQGSRCTGVRIISAEGQRAITATQEVIVASGGVGSPKLLMLSGIGRADELRKIGISTAVNLPGVGMNFQDHPLLEGIIMEYKGAMPARNPHNNGVETVSFLRSSAHKPGPDLQPTLIQAPVPTAAIRKKFGPPPAQGFTITPGLVRPTGRGYVRLASGDWRDNPLLDSGFLSTEADLDAAVACIEHCLELSKQDAFTKISKQVIPGRALSKAELVDFARDSTTSYYHPVGTCKMGTDAMAVVDPSLRVHGILGLRVCDSAIMPTITTGNTNAPSQAIGAKAAQIIIASIK